MEEWWKPDQKEIAQNKSRIWVKKRFKAVPGFWMIRNGNRILGKTSDHEKIPEDAILNNSAWDHEHCALCWEKISERSAGQQEGYTDGKE
jgi:hypothetical protein